MFEEHIHRIEIEEGVFEQTGTVAGVLLVGRQFEAEIGERFHCYPHFQVLGVVFHHLLVELRTMGNISGRAQLVEEGPVGLLQACHKRPARCIKTFTEAHQPRIRSESRNDIASVF